MAKSKITNYLKYALGETLLVVLGILIALQVNVWNEKKKERNEERKALCELRADFEETRNNLSRTLRLQKTMLHYSVKLIDIMEREDFSQPTDTIMTSFGEGTWSWYRFEPVIGAYDALIASNNLSLIKNTDLKYELAKFFSEARLGFEDHQESINIIKEMEVEMSPYISDILPVQKKIAKYGFLMFLIHYCTNHMRRNS